MSKIAKCIKIGKEIVFVGQSLKSALECRGQFLTIPMYVLHCVGQWTSHPLMEEKTRIQIPPGYKVFSENIPR
jgi:hypothetical protein